MMNTDTKRCIKCGEHKSTSAFSPSKCHGDRLFPYCKPCNNKYSQNRKRIRLETGVYKGRFPIKNGIKICTRCGKEKPISEFWRHYESWYPKCKACCLLKSREWREKYPEKYRAAIKRYRERRRIAGSRARRIESIRIRYKITEQQYLDMLNRQNGCCAICSIKLDEKLCIDHCHATGKIRGLLCHNCNFGIGLFKDSIELLTLASKYLGG